MSSGMPALALACVSSSSRVWPTVAMPLNCSSRTSNGAVNGVTTRVRVRSHSAAAGQCTMPTTTPGTVVRCRARQRQRRTHPVVGTNALHGTQQFAAAVQ